MGRSRGILGVAALLLAALVAATPQARAQSSQRDATPEVLTPGPGRAPVEVRASGAALEASGVTRVYRLEDAMLGRDDGTVMTPQGDATAAVHGAGCRTPCTLYVPTGTFELAARGGGFDSMRFTLTVPPTGLRVLLRTPDSGVHALGATLLALGTIAVVAGAVLAVVSVAGGPHALLAPGIGTAIGGGAAMILGGVLVGVSGPALLEARTRVALRPGFAPLAGGGAQIALALTL